MGYVQFQRLLCIKKIFWIGETKIHTLSV